jgi:hypothetical protein
LRHARSRATPPQRNGMRIARTFAAPEKHQNTSGRSPPAASCCPSAVSSALASARDQGGHHSASTGQCARSTSQPSCAVCERVCVCVCVCVRVAVWLCVWTQGWRQQLNCGGPGERTSAFGARTVVPAVRALAPLAVMPCIPHQRPCSQAQPAPLPRPTRRDVGAGLFQLRDARTRRPARVPRTSQHPCRPHLVCELRVLVHVLRLRPHPGQQHQQRLGDDGHGAQLVRAIMLRRGVARARGRAQPFQTQARRHDAVCERGKWVHHGVHGPNRLTNAA